MALLWKSEDDYCEAAFEHVEWSEFMEEVILIDIAQFNEVLGKAAREIKRIVPFGTLANRKKPHAQQYLEMAPSTGPSEYKPVLTWLSEQEMTDTRSPSRVGRSSANSAISTITTPTPYRTLWRYPAGSP